MGTSQLRDAFLTSISIGRTTQPGDLRALYEFAIKDANSMISQFTDDDLGTGVGVNIATHHIRMDYTSPAEYSFPEFAIPADRASQLKPGCVVLRPIGA